MSSLKLFSAIPHNSTHMITLSLPSFLLQILCGTYGLVYSANINTSYIIPSCLYYEIRKSSKVRTTSNFSLIAYDSNTYAVIHNMHSTAWVHPYHRILLYIKTEQTIDTYNNSDGSQSSEPISKDHILYDSIYRTLSMTKL